MIRKLMENENGKRIEMIIKELGDIGVDGGIMKR